MCIRDRYAPVVLKEDFHSAIAYLVRRLDENTSEENFLHDLFGMTPGSRSWCARLPQTLARSMSRTSSRTATARLTASSLSAVWASRYSASSSRTQRGCTMESRINCLLYTSPD